MQEATSEARQMFLDTKKKERKTTKQDTMLDARNEQQMKRDTC